MGNSDTPRPEPIRDGPQSGIKKAPSPTHWHGTPDVVQSQSETAALHPVQAEHSHSGQDHPLPRASHYAHSSTVHLLNSSLYKRRHNSCISRKSALEAAHCSKQRPSVLDAVHPDQLRSLIDCHTTHSYRLGSTAWRLERQLTCRQPLHSLLLYRVNNLG